MIKNLNINNNSFFLRYPESIQIKIPNNVQISNMILNLKNKYQNKNELIEKIREGLQERNYKEKTIQKWLTYASTYL